PSGGETWYATTVFYHFTIKIGNTTYIPNAGSKMIFTVRNAGTAEDPKWKLVELRDLGGASLLSATGAASTEPTTYGAMKARYYTGFKSRTQIGDVLYNFELAHNRLDSNHYVALLDDNFTFFYTEPDGGAGTPVQWGRDVDVPTTAAMFAGVDS